MKELVTIKSFPSGLNVFLDADVDFSDIQKAVSDKFQASRMFFKNSGLAISFEGRNLSDTEEKILLKAISDNSDINIICLVGKDEQQEKTFIKAVKRIEQKENCGGLVIRGGLKDGQCIESEGAVVVYGDVNPGCCIKAGAEVVILGGLYGEVIISSKKEESESPFVFSLDMQPKEILINGVALGSHQKKNKWGLHPKYSPKLAHISDNTIVIDSFSKMSGL